MPVKPGIAVECFSGVSGVCSLSLGAVGPEGQRHVLN